MHPILGPDEREKLAHVTAVGDGRKPVANAAHAFLAPSSAHRWVFCPGSARMEAAQPQAGETPATAEGTAAHWVVECLLLHDRTPTADEVAPNGVPIDAEMIEAAQLVRDDVAARLGTNWRTTINVEQRVTIPRVHPKNWGTPDIWAFQQLADGSWMLHVWDFKYGYKVVEAFENWQCINYASGILSQAGLDEGGRDLHTFVSICVIQPRAPHRDGSVRRWTVRASDLRGHVNRLHSAAEEACSDNPMCRPEPSACEDCRARVPCEANQRAAFRAAALGYASQPLDITPAGLGLELRNLTRAKQILDARIAGLEEVADALIRKGVPVAWHALESTPGRLAWTKPAAEVFALGEMLGVSFAKQVDPVTPTQAKAMLPAALKPTIDAFAQRPPGALKLVADDGSKARRVFT